MFIIDDKNNITGKIAALKTLSGGLPKINIRSLFSNNGTNPIVYLLNLFQITTGSNNLKNLIPEFIVSKTFDLETKIISNLLNELANTYTCGNILNFTDEQKTNGIDISVKEIDLFNKTYYSPTSTYGDVLYSNANIDKLIYDAIQANGNNVENDLFILRYNLSNDTINFKPKVNTLNEFNTKFLNNIKFFNPKLIYFSIFDYSFNLLGKTKARLKKEEEINKVLDNIIKSETTTIEDRFFEFSQDENIFITLQSESKFNKVVKLKSCDEIDTFVEETSFENGVLKITENITIVELEKLFDEQYDNIMSNVSPSNKNISIIELVSRTLNDLPVILLRLIIRPDIMMLFAINNKVLGAEDNKDLFRKMINVIAATFGSLLLTYLVMFLLQKFIKLLTPLLINKKVVDTKERLNNKKKLYKSIFGINDKVLNISKRLNNLSLPEINKISLDIDSFTENNSI